MVTKKLNIFLLILITIIAGAVWYSYYNSTFNGLLYNDAMDYASMARNIARGEGVTSAYITPLGLQYYGVPHPNPWRAPLWPIILAMTTKSLGFNDNIVSITTGLFFILTVPLIYLIGRKLFSPLVGFFAGVIFSFSALALNFSISGLTEPLAVFLMSLWIYLLISDKLSNSFGDFLIGFVGGIFYLARYNALVFLPFVLMFLLFRRRDRKVFIVMRFLAGFLLPVIPWFWRNYVLFGSPLFSLQKFEPVMFTPSYPQYSLYMMMERPDVLEFISNNYLEILTKVETGWVVFYQNLLNSEFTGIHAWLMVLFLVSLIVPLGKKLRGVKLLLVGCFLTQLAALLVIHYIPRLFFIFIPFYIILGLGLFERIVDLLPGRNKFKRVIKAIAVTGLSAFVILGNLPDWNSKHNPEPLFKKFSEQINAVAGIASKSDLIISNDGHIFSWYGDRTTSKIPYSPDSLPQLNKFQEAKFIFLSSRASWNIPEADKEWQNIYWSKPKEFQGYNLVKNFDDGSLLYKKSD